MIKRLLFTLSALLVVFCSVASASPFSSAQPPSPLKGLYDVYTENNDPYYTIYVKLDIPGDVPPYALVPYSKGYLDLRGYQTVYLHAYVYDPTDGQYHIIREQWISVGQSLIFDPSYAGSANHKAYPHVRA